MPKKEQVKEVREAIAKKLRIGKARIYEIAKDLADNASVLTEDGIYMLALSKGINLTKYLPGDKIKEIRALSQQFNPPAPNVLPQNSERKAPTTVRRQTINIEKEFNIIDPILPNKILKEAKEMSENVYPLLYILENSIRELILRVMQNKYGNNWWDTKVNNNIIKEVQRRFDHEQNNPWHGKRGAHKIYYTDISHLGHIIQNNWSDFKDILPHINWLTQRLNEINHSRNPVAHMNPLKKNDIARIKVYFNDWQNQIKSKLSAIP